MFQWLNYLNVNKHPNQAVCSNIPLCSNPMKISKNAQIHVINRIKSGKTSDLCQESRPESQLVSPSVAFLSFLPKKYFSFVVYVTIKPYFLETFHSIMKFFFNPQIQHRIFEKCSTYVNVYS